MSSFWGGVLRLAPWIALSRLFAAFLIEAIALSLASSAAAHSIGLSRADYRVSGDVVVATYVFSGAEVAAAMPEVDVDHDGRLSPAEISQAGEAVDRRVVDATIVDADGSTCRPHLDSVEAAYGDGVQIRASFRCDHAPRTLTIDCRFIAAFSAGHRHLATVFAHAHETSFILVSGRERLALTLDATTRAGSTFGAMVWTGVTHIWTGYDHLAFLFGLLLPGGRLRTLVGIVSAFTVAHSLTLALAALGVVSPAPSIVEPAIALSIVYVGLENLFVSHPSRRWRVTFFFGLVHGFGFAGALRELDLPRAQMPIALCAFNLGVEMGQIAVVAAVLPIIVWARHRWAFRVWGVRGLSVALSLAGSVWFVLRVVR